MKFLRPPARPASQSGVVLVASLMFLLVMTMLGLSGMQGTSLEEKMTGTMRDRALAFQAAESALRAAEASLSPGGSLPSFTTGGANGFFSKSVAAPPDLKAVWNSPNQVSRYSGEDLAHVAQVPTYIIEELSYTSGGGSDTGGSLRGDIPAEAGAAKTWYRVTARGTGGTDAAVVVLQSVYRR